MPESIPSRQSFDKLCLNELEHLFHQSFSSTKTEKSIRICNQSLQIHFCSRAIEEAYYPALQHLNFITSQDKSPFNLFVIDVKDIQNPSFDCLKNFLNMFFANLNLQSHQLPEKYESFRFLAFEDFAYFYSHSLDFGAWFVFNSKSFSHWHFANPFRYFLYDWLLQEGYQLVHASGVSDGKSALIFTGSSGSGKSTTALAAFKAEYSILGDDHCALSLGSNLKAYSLFNTIKLDESLLEHEFLYLKSYVHTYIRTEKISKGLVHTSQVSGAELANDVPVKALLTLKVSNKNEPASITPIEPASLAKTLILTTVEQCKWIDRKDVFRNITEIANQAPCYHLQLSHNFNENIQLIRRLFDA